jgi:hypothetical protein
MLLLYKKTKKGLVKWLSSRDNQWFMVTWLIRAVSWLFGLGEVPVISIQLIRMMLLYYQKRSIKKLSIRLLIDALGNSS